jgi:solute carrier family 35 (adenosine 3'-phospho 5'-phosphosulfate transporter), member B3
MSSNIQYTRVSSHTDSNGDSTSTHTDTDIELGQVQVHSASSTIYDDYDNNSELSLELDNDSAQITHSLSASTSTSTSTSASSKLHSTTTSSDSDGETGTGTGTGTGAGTGTGTGTSASAEREQEPTRLLCFDISWLSDRWQLMALSGGLLFFFLANGYVEEYLFAALPGFQYSWYLTFFELSAFAGLAVIERKLRFQQTWEHKNDLKKHMITAIAMTMSRGLTNMSLQFLNYPTQVMFKSAKLLATMIASILFLRKTYVGKDYVSALLLISSAAIFSIGDRSVQPNFDVTGVIIVLLSLVADGSHAVVQEVTLHGGSLHETLIYSNIFSALATLVIVVGKGELGPAMQYCQEHPIAYFLFIIRSTVVYLGVVCFASIVKKFDAVTATTVTTVRKIMTVLLSFVIFPKPFSLVYVLGIAFFCAGVYIPVYVN